MTWLKYTAEYGLPDLNWFERDLNLDSFERIRALLSFSTNRAAIRAIEGARASGSSRGQVAIVTGQYLQYRSARRGRRV